MTGVNVDLIYYDISLFMNQLFHHFITIMLLFYCGVILNTRLTLQKNTVILADNSLCVCPFDECKQTQLLNEVNLSEIYDKIRYYNQNNHVGESSCDH